MDTIYWQLTSNNRRIFNIYTWLWLIRARNPRGLDKGCGSKFYVDSHVRQETPEEDQKTYKPKHEYNNKDEDNCPKTLNVKKLWINMWRVECFNDEILKFKFHLQVYRIISLNFCHDQYNLLMFNRFFGLVLLNTFWQTFEMLCWPTKNPLFHFLGNLSWVYSQTAWNMTKEGIFICILSTRQRGAEIF